MAGSALAVFGMVRDVITKGATVTVEWGDEEHTIVLTLRNWRRIQRCQPLTIRGRGYSYEGEFFWDYWNFCGGALGSLRVEYGDDGGVGFEGSLSDATIQEI
jgi:hypothetical protein